MASCLTVASAPARLGLADRSSAPPPRQLRPRRMPCLRDLGATISSSSEIKSKPSRTHRSLGIDRRMLLGGAVSLGLFQRSEATAEETISLLEDKEGFGQLQARKGDLLLVHYIGKLKDTGDVFDSTRGSQTYLDGGPGVFRPMIIQLGSAPVPGICAGLKQGLEGSRVGTVRTFDVPPSLGFGAQSVAGPYAIVPGGSTLTYEVEVLRLSRDGPDALMKSVSQCGQGGAGAQEAGCGGIVPME